MRNSEQTRTLHAMAATARMVDAHGAPTDRPLPLRYRVARHLVERQPECGWLTWQQARCLGLTR